jgi:hypothetical protein
MKHIVLSLCTCFVLSCIASAQKMIEVKEVGKSRFEANFPAGGELRLDLRSGEVLISGTGDDKIRVHYDGRDAANTDDLKITFKTLNNTGGLHLSGGPRNNFRIIIEVPKTLDLYVRVPFGETEIEGITGNKDVEMHAGELRLGIGSASDYSHVEASVSSGELDADPFGVEKGGLFRSFKREGSGKYRLHAHVGAGQLTLR